MSLAVALGYVFSNLPGNAFNTLVRAFLSLELTMTFPIVLKPASDVIEQIMKNFLLVRTGFSSWLEKSLKTHLYSRLRLFMFSVL